VSYDPSEIILTCLSTAQEMKSYQPKTCCILQCKRLKGSFGDLSNQFYLGTIFRHYIYIVLMKHNTPHLKKVRKVARKLPNNHLII